MKALQKFFHPVGKPRAHKIRFLREHLRFYTLNGWTGATSYANQIMLGHGMPSNPSLALADSMKPIFERLDRWANKHSYQWQAAFQGENNDYLVLYSGNRKFLDYLTQCNTCGVQTWYEREQPCHAIGCRGTLKVLPQPRAKTYLHSSVGIDMNETFESWDMHKLRTRVGLVQSFDRLCDEVVRIHQDVFPVSQQVVPAIERGEPVIA